MHRSLLPELASPAHYSYRPTAPSKAHRDELRVDGCDTLFHCVHYRPSACILVVADL